MADDEKLSQLIGVLYETVMAPERMTETLEYCSDYIGANGAHLLITDKATGRIRKEFYGGSYIDSQDFTAWVNGYLLEDPRMTSGMMANIGVNEWRFCHTFLDDGFVARNPLYQEFLIPIGVRYTLGGLVDETTDSKIMLGFFRAQEQSPFGIQEQAAAKRISPHLQRALRLNSHTQHLQAKAELGVTAIEALAWPLLIVDGDACILHLNTRAEQLLTAHFGGLSCRFGRLHCFDPSAADELAALVRQATKHPALGGGMCLHALPGARILVAPLPAASQWIKDWQRPLALVLIAENSEMLSGSKPFDLDFGDWSKLGVAKCDPVAGFAKTYQLTGRETEVLQGLTDGLSPKQIAERDDVSRNTVRTQLSSLMQKTHCHSQKDLIRLFLISNKLG
ncbi:helix-turn-helix transcriptional regulator [Methylomonas sp. MK1]|uniref:helix-turn-helix transcriptional regulator n=1 Tax=Methylomonas sp. MK1 TaxID=1131552 RepID=UPI001360B184|nr:helix-turn-helix transcriptional regulator [Methylomonas sp. MK1]